LFKSIFCDWMTACGTTAALRAVDDGPLAVDSSSIAKRTGAIIADETPRGSDALFEVRLSSAAGSKATLTRQLPLEGKSVRASGGVYVLSTKGAVLQWNGHDSTPQVPIDEPTSIYTSSPVKIRRNLENFRPFV
jgi:hypothetical protein